MSEVVPPSPRRVTVKAQALPKADRRGAEPATRDAFASELEAVPHGEATRTSTVSRVRLRLSEGRCEAVGARHPSSAERPRNRVADSPAMAGKRRRPEEGTVVVEGNRGKRDVAADPVPAAASVAVASATLAAADRPAPSARRDESSLTEKALEAVADRLPARTDAPIAPAGPTVLPPATERSGERPHGTERPPVAGRQHPNADRVRPGETPTDAAPATADGKARAEAVPSTAPASIAAVATPRRTPAGESVAMLRSERHLPLSRDLTPQRNDVLPPDVAATPAPDADAPPPATADRIAPRTDVAPGEDEAAPRDDAAGRASAAALTVASPPSDPPSRIPAPVLAAADLPPTAAASGTAWPRLADALGAILAAADSEAATTSSATVPLPTPMAASAVRALTLRVESADHGPMTVRMTLAGTSLSLQLRPESEQAADRLRRHRDELATELSDLGYDVDIVLAPPRDGGLVLRAPDLPGNLPAGSPSGDAGSTSTAGHDPADPRRSGRPPADGLRHSREGDARERPAAHRRHGDLYV